VGSIKKSISHRPIAVNGFMTNKISTYSFLHQKQMHNYYMKQTASKAIMRVFNGNLKLDNAALTKLFLKQLDNIYCIKKHLLTILPSLADKACFPDLRDAILESADLIKVQLLRMDVIYKIYKTSCKIKNCVGVKTLSLEAYLAARIEEQSPVERDLALLIHLQITESVEMAYFDVLRHIADSLNNKEVQTLLEQNFEAAVSSKKLYQLIAKEYIS
jgi:ferritin-like metal-binding protein YciE